jgi:protein O-GlcNAc transferase
VAQALGRDLGRAARLKLQRKFCDWAESGSRTDELVRHVANDGSKCVEAFLLAGLPTSAETQLTNARKITRYFDDVYDPTRRIRSVVRRDRIRLGYFSADFYDHAVAVLIAGVFEHHDRSRFEITAFALNPPLAVEDDMRKRLIPAFDRFIDVFSRADDEIAKLSRDLEIDIAIDLHGHTQYSRTGIFARRAVQYLVVHNASGARIRIHGCECDRGSGAAGHSHSGQERHSD